MVRYFINYEDLIENNVIDKNISLYSSCLFIKKKMKKGLVKFVPLFNYIGNNSNILNYVKKLNYSKKGLLMVELSYDEMKEFDELLIKKYEPIEDNVCKKVFVKNDNTIKLINYKTLFNMNDDELSKGNIVVLMPCVSNNNYMYISGDRSRLAREYNINDRRDMLIKFGVGSDIYFHTKDEELLNLYKNDITEVKEIDFCKYEILNHKLFVLDSINNSDIIGFNADNYYCLDILSYNSTPIFISESINGYKLNTRDNKDYIKKGYIINSLYLERFLNNDALKPLIKYINVYELVDGIYKKIPLEKHLNDIKILKCTKKNW